MLLDIYAAQQIYGANTATRNTNTTYGFNSNAGAPYDFSIGTTRAFCIWDGGGTDTIDASGYSQSQIINLNAETFSNIGGLTNNVSIALGVTVENAFGGSGADTITGNSASNMINGGSGNDTIAGGDGGDVLFGGIGADALRGEVGNDVLVGDGLVTWDANAAAIHRLYLATLRRAPDDAGLQNWVAYVQSGQTLQQAASGFITSTEFQSVYGALNNTQFVTLLYNNVLHRAPDPSGLSNWVNLLNSGSSRESVVVGFSESNEFRTATDITQISGQVYRMYDSAFNRGADAGGFDNWSTSRYGGATLNDLATNFMASAEFTATYGAYTSLTNGQFVNLLYSNVLNRTADTTGFNNWVSALNGGVTRADALVSFSESAEHVNLMATGLDSFMTTTMASWQDTLTGGSGNDVLTGGHGADIFVFAASAAWKPGLRISRSVASPQAVATGLPDSVPAWYTGPSGASCSITARWPPKAASGMPPPITLPNTLRSGAKPGISLA